MKVLPAALQTHVALPTTSLAYGLKITREDATVYGFTSHESDDTIDSVVYQSSPGVEVTSIVNTAGLQVGNLELTTLDDGEVFTTEDILSGKWRNASFTLFRYNWASLSDGVETLMVGTLGEIEIKQSQLVVELRDLRQYLQHPVGSPSTKTCRYRLGDSRCGVSLATSPNTFTLTGSVTSLNGPSKQIFFDTARTEADRWFEGGILTWTSGNNTGLSMPVKSFSSGSPSTTKEFTLWRPMIQAIQVGDTYQVTAGCDKTLETCISKFANVLNFGGEPHRPTLDEITQAPATAV
jgi:uncharacterized phage protein (TIGR02218 family)